MDPFDELLDSLAKTELSHERRQALGELAQAIKRQNPLYDELEEAKAELSRHHRDFSRISAIVHEALSDDRDEVVIARMRLLALRRIRGIVG